MLKWAVLACFLLVCATWVESVVFGVEVPLMRDSSWCVSLYDGGELLVAWNGGVPTDSFGFGGPRRDTVRVAQWLPKAIRSAPVIGAPIDIVTVPLWIPAIPIGLCCVFLFLRDHRGIAPSHCQECGYDLTGNMSGVCPECGTPADYSDH